MDMMLLLQQQQPPPSVPGILDNPVTFLAFISIILAALVPHVNKIAGAIIQIIESLAGMVAEWQRGMKARNDIIVELREQISEAFDQKNVSVKQELEAQENTNKAQAITNVAQANTNEAQRNANESLRLANEATVNLVKERLDRESDLKRLKTLEDRLTEEESKRKAAEAQVAALTLLIPPTVTPDSSST